ncbi:MAG: hypothetical protein QOE66_937 [Chloroflexota bacterium]|jgi:hypothetical protein|nr:hypothetical protein [Chloroflexota bacterium]
MRRLDAVSHQMTFKPAFEQVPSSNGPRGAQPALGRANGAAREETIRLWVAPNGSARGASTARRRSTGPPRVHGRAALPLADPLEQPIRR